MVYIRKGYQALLYLGRGSLRTVVLVVRSTLWDSLLSEIGAATL